MKKWPSVIQDLIGEPERVLGCMGVAMHQVVKQNMEIRAGKRISVRIVGMKPLQNFDLLMRSCHGNLVTFTGTLMKLEPQIIKCKWMSFKCSLCESELAVRQKPSQRSMIQPSSCRQGCRGREFIPQLATHSLVVKPSKSLISKKIPTSIKAIPQCAPLK
jgi:DNA replicative helicase MCM subunit Mcm2 (Cdc46/Mcm family)